MAAFVKDLFIFIYDMFIGFPFYGRFDVLKIGEKKEGRKADTLPPPNQDFKQ